MRVLITGVGDAFTRVHFGSSAVVEGPAGRVLIDCPDPIHRVLHDAAQRSGWDVEVETIHDLVLTHLHGDHCNGLESFAFWRRVRALQAGLQRPRLHLSAAALARLWDRLAPAMEAPFGQDRPSELSDYFDVHVLNDPEAGIQVQQIAGLTVRCRYTKHTIPTTALLVSDGTSTLGWSSDTPFDPSLIEWLSEADLIVHESNLGGPHTPIEDLNRLDSAVKRKIRLIHLPDSFDRSSTDLAILEPGDVLSF